MSTRPEITRNVISLIRVSTEIQSRDDKNGLDSQRQDVQDTCEDLNLDDNKQFQLIDVPGTMVSQTPEYKQLAALVKQKHIAGLVIPEVTRLSRTTDFDLLAALMEPLKVVVNGKNTKTLFYQDKELDVTNGEHREIIFNEARYGEREREKIKRRTMKGKDKRRKVAAAKSDKIPAGISFTRPDEKKSKDGVWSWTLDADGKPARKALMRSAFMRVLAGERIQAIANDLGFGSATTLRNCLKIRLWCGFKCKMSVSINHGWDADKQKFIRTAQPLTEAERKEFEIRIPELADDPCVTVEEFDAVQKVLAVNVTTWTQNKSLKSDFLAIGLMYCACGKKMYTKQNYRHKVPGQKYYISARAQTGKGLDTCECGLIHADRIDDKIRLTLRTTFTNDEAIDAAIRESMDGTRTEEKKTAVERSEKAVKELERQAKNVEDGAIKLGYTDERVARIKTIETDLIQARMKVETAKAALAAILTDADIDKAKVRLKSDFYWFDRLDMQHQQAMLRKYVERIDLRHDDPLGIEPGLVFQFRVPVFDEPEPARTPRSPKGPGTNRVMTTAQEYGRVESKDDVVRRLTTDSKVKISSTSAFTNSACTGP
jgi:DNA invertase Pin-like site-specific DNA recombinase